MIKKTIRVVQFVEVTIDETKFTQEFMDEFNTNMFHCEDLDDHMKYLGCQFARGYAGQGFNDDFIEGYGVTGDMGIELEVVHYYEELE